MAIVGMRSNSDVTQYRERPENWRMGILMLDPNGDAPLYGLTSMMGSEATDDPSFNWFEEELPTYRVVLSADINTSVTSLPVTAGALTFKEGDMIRIEATEELVLVTADPVSDIALTVIRGFAGSTAASVDVSEVNPNMMLIGSVHEEGSAAPSGRTYNATEHQNQVQIFRDTVDITNTARKTRLRTGDVVKEDKRRCLSRHSIGIERAIIFGRKSTTMKNGKPRRTMGGIISQIPTANVFSPLESSGRMTMAEFENHLRLLFVYGSQEKLCFAGNRFMLGVQQLCRYNADFQLMPMEKEYGMLVRRFVTPFGVLVLKTHPQFNYLSSPENLAFKALDTWGLVIDAKFLKYRYLDGRDTTFEPNLQLPGVDGLQAGYITECGIQVSHPKTFGLFKGVTGGLKDPEPTP